MNKIQSRLRSIYEEEVASQHSDHFQKLIEGYRKKFSFHSLQQQTKWSEKDVMLITYGDSVKDRNSTPLNTLSIFLDTTLQRKINRVHILPFFPYSSDDGFSVIDFEQVDSALGSWKEIEHLGKKYSLMFDLVLNHASAQSEWFQQFIKNVSPGKDYFATANPGDDLKKVVRPRSTPLLTPVETAAGLRHVWTTFSADQVDLDYANPYLLREMLRIFLEYIRYGATAIRLDAIAFLWKEIGTTCVHLKQTHEVVKLFRDVVDEVAPHVIVLTETNVPHQENISYFGNGDEADMVYQFSLPPLLLHALLAGDATWLTQWGVNLAPPPDGCTFFNFTASHDGVGVRPLEGLLPDEQKQKLCDYVYKVGGKINERDNGDGTTSPYELNTTYFDALKGTLDTPSGHFQNERFICSQAVMLSMQGLPAFYIHSLLATPNYIEGVEQTGENRTINRRKWKLSELSEHLQQGAQQVLDQLLALIDLRKKQIAFHPDIPQKVYDLGKQFFCIVRQSSEQTIVCLFNMTAQPQEIAADRLPVSSVSHDIISRQKFSGVLPPYHFVWLV